MNERLSYPKGDPCWRRSLLAAHLIERARAGRVTARDRRLGAFLKADPGVTNQLIDQARASRNGRARQRQERAHGAA